MSTVPTVTLNNGVTMPQLGLGVWRVPDADATHAVTTALNTGYRSIDTAALYQNEPGVGRAIAATDIDRTELFVTTKLQNGSQGYDSTLRAFDESLSKLGLDYVDLYLIHWPTPARDLYSQTWQAFERIYAEGRAKAIGVSNFNIPHLERLAVESDVTPVINQIELHPYLPQTELRAYHAANGIATEAWSPLGQGGRLLTEPALAELADQHGKTPAQVIVRWHLQLGNVVIPKSVTPSRIAENFDVFDFTLTDDQMKLINTLENGTRLGPDPDQVS